MRTIIGILLVLLLTYSLAPFASAQSLAEVARNEADRRQKLALLGVEAKKIDGSDPLLVAPGGAITISSTGESRAAPAKASATKTEARESLRSYQSRLQKLDRDIAQTEQKLKLLRMRADAERSAAFKSTKGSISSGLSSQDKMKWQILELEGKLDSLRSERSNTFLAGRRAGYLPGELEGRVR